jgi:hypothetical protein
LISSIKVALWILHPKAVQKLLRDQINIAVLIGRPHLQLRERGNAAERAGAV